jgi:hypothetical protein
MVKVMPTFGCEPLVFFPKPETLDEEKDRRDVTQKQVTNLYEHYPYPKVNHVVTVDLVFGGAKI